MTTNQLSVKIQDTLGAVGFEAAITAEGGQHFLYGNVRAVVRVEAIEEGATILVTAVGNGHSHQKEYPAAMLERHTEAALMLMFQTIIAFA